MEVMTFSLGDVLNVATGRLVTDMDAIYRLINHMTGDILFTHQLPRACEPCKTSLLKIFPILSVVDEWIPLMDKYLKSAGNNREAVRRALHIWLQELADGTMLPATYEVPAKCCENWVTRDPIAEILEMKNSV